MDKGLHPLFPQEKWSRNSQELPMYNPRFHCGQIYNALLLNHIEPEIEKILCKNENDFRRNRSSTSKYFRPNRYSWKKYQGNTICWLLQGIDMAFLANIPAQAESLLFSLERATGGMSTQTKQSSCALIKEATSPHKIVDPWYLWTSSPTSEAASHLPRMTSTRD